MRKGFTLVELAIVLIIISVVIGAIIGARDLIESAKLNGIISDFKKYESAYNDFKQKYNAIPGDIPDANIIFNVPDQNCPDDYNGNGNGVIDFSNNVYDGALTGTPGETEAGYAMHMLSQAGFIDFKPHPDAISCTGVVQLTNYSAGRLYPESTLKNATFAIVALGSGIDTFKNRIIFGNYSETVNPKIASLNSIETAIIDKRIDDGKASTGNLRGVSSYTDIGGSQYGCVDLSTLDYAHLTAPNSESAKNKSCSIHYYLD
jgi:prepilin-type N-terminal cleavage/methylation domain-containing protein